MTEFVRIRKPPAEPTARRTFHHESSEGGGSRTLGSFLLGIAAFGLLVAMTVYHVTDERRATSAIADFVSSVTDADRLVANQMPFIRQAADQGEPFSVPGFPIDVQVTPEEADGKSSAEVRDILVMRSATEVYNNGLDAFDISGTQSISMFSVEGMMERLIGRLDSSTHSQARMAMYICGAILIIGSVLRAAPEEGFRGFRTVGMPVAAAGIIGLVIAFAFRFLVDRAGGDDPFTNDVRSVIAAMVDLGIRNFAVGAIAGLVVVLLDPILTFTYRKLAPESANEPIPDFVRWDHEHEHDEESIGV